MIFSDEVKTVNKLLEKFKNGNKSALDTIFRITNSKLTYFAYKYSHNKDLIDDIISETFVNVLKYIGTYNVTKNGLSWLIKIVKNTALQFNRDAIACDNFDDVELSYDESENLENRILIGEIVLLLDKEENKYFEYYFVYEYSLRQIAEILGISKSTVARKVSQLKNKIWGVAEKWDK